MQTNYIDVSASVTAAQIAAALGCDHFSISGYEVFTGTGDTTAGFAISGLETVSWGVYAYVNGSVVSDSLDWFTTKLYYAKKDNYVLFGSNPSDYNLYKAIIKGTDGNGDPCWGYFSVAQGTSKYGHIWTKDSTSIKVLGITFTVRAAGTALSLAPLFDPVTGFVSDPGVYAVAYMPETLTSTSAVYRIAMGEKTFSLVTSSNIQCIHFAFEE